MARFCQGCYGCLKPCGREEGLTNESKVSMRNVSLAIVMAVAFGVTMVTYYSLKDEPSLAERIQVGVDRCMDIVGFWPCSTRNLEIVQNKVCPLREEAN